MNLEVGFTKAAIFVDLSSFLEQKEAYAISGGVWGEEDRNMRMWGSFYNWWKVIGPFV